jgi:hypothetical protein
MRPRPLCYSLADIAFDYEAISAALTASCQRMGQGFYISAVCQTQDSVIFPVERNGHKGKVRYVLTPFAGQTHREVSEDLFTRWSSGFTTRGLVALSDSYLGLFEIHD